MFFAGASLERNASRKAGGNPPPSFDSASGREAQRSDAKREDIQTSFIFAPMHFPFQAEKAHQLTGLLAIRGQPDFRERRPLRALSL